MIGILLLLGTGILLSAFFSGSETGFYRVQRLRLAVSAIAGDWTSAGLLWLSNRPSWFVATTLVGNNLANYLTSLAIVMASDRLIPGGGTWVDLLGPILLAPILFIAGELLPKNLFYHAPNRLLRRCAPALFVCTVLFLPLTIILWSFSKILQMATNSSPQEMRLSLARRELAELLAEGHEAGILRPVQQTLAHAMLSIALQPVKNFASTSGRAVRATTTMSKSAVFRIAQRNGCSLLPVEDPSKRRQLVGYFRMADLYLSNKHSLPEPRPLVPLQEDESLLSALRKLSQAEDALGHVVRADGSTVGFITGRELRFSLLR
jgi:magnesium and cobalt exporter, CNNM family